MEALNEPSLFHCCNQIEPFQCRACPNFQTNFLAHLKRHLSSGHRKDDPEENIYKCNKCSFVTFSILHPVRRYLISNECATMNIEEEKVQIKDEATDSPWESRNEIIDGCKWGFLINSEVNSNGSSCIELNRSFKSKNRDRHSKPEDVHWFQCAQCPKFKHKENKQKQSRAEYMRGYRAKIKATRTQSANKKPKQSRAQYMKQYRAKIKETKMQNPILDNRQRQSKAEYMREYRAKIKTKMQSASTEQKQSKAEYMREYRAKIKETKMQNTRKPPPLSSTERWRKCAAKQRNDLTRATSSGATGAGNGPTDPISDRLIAHQQEISPTANQSVTRQLVTHQREDSQRPATGGGVMKSKPPPLSSTERARRSRNNKRKNASASDRRRASENSLSTYYKHGLIVNNNSTLNESSFLRKSYIAPVINNSENLSIVIHEYRAPTNAGEAVLSETT